MTPDQPFLALLNNAKQTMSLEGYNNLTPPECEQLLHQRIQKFYSGNDHIDVADEHFKPRIEPNYSQGVTTANDTAILFGIDFLTKVALKYMFAPYQTEIELIDESNCLLRFPNH